MRDIVVKRADENYSNHPYSIALDELAVALFGGRQVKGKNTLLNADKVVSSRAREHCLKEGLLYISSHKISDYDKIVYRRPKINCDYSSQMARYSSNNRNPMRTFKVL
jgi:hypothetical protein